MRRFLACATLILSLTSQVTAQVRVDGRVLDSLGKPIPGAQVALVRPGFEDRSLAGALLTRTSPQGAFALAAPPIRIGLAMTAPGYLPHYENLDLRSGKAPRLRVIRMKRGGHSIQGTVVSGLISELEGVRVAFLRSSKGQGETFVAEVQQGKFEVSLAPGAYLLRAIAKGQVAEQRLEVKGDQADVRIHLKPEGSPADPQVLAWIKAGAIPLRTVEAGKGFKDMQPLRTLVGDATVVALGEATHGTREFFQLKHRMLEFLATEMGFTVFAIEANLPEAFKVDEYVLSGKGDPAKALAGLYFWTWDTQEVMDMILWMRAYNEDPAHAKKLRFYGIDMQQDAVAYAQAKAWLDKVLPEEALKLGGIRARMARLPALGRGNASAEDRKAWSTLVPEIEALLARLEVRKGDLAGTEGDDTFDRQRQNLRVLAQFSAMQAAADGPSRVRDEAMAANVRWIQEREPGGRMVLWAHNMHVSSQPPPFRSVPGMGYHLRKALGNAYRPIGFAFREGGFQAKNTDSMGVLRTFEVSPAAGGTLDEALASAEHPILALDLRTLPKQGPVRDWFDGPQGTWSIGALFSAVYPHKFTLKEPVTGSYDALLFVDRTTPAQPLRLFREGVPVRTALSKAPANLGFEEGLDGWFTPSHPSYAVMAVTLDPKEGARCLQVSFQGDPVLNTWYSAMQAVDPAPFRGRKVRVSGWVRTDGSPDFRAGLWMRVDRKEGKGFFDNMARRPITGAEWTRAVIEGQVDEDAASLNFGCIANGVGTAWYDSIEIEILP